MDAYKRRQRLSIVSFNFKVQVRVLPKVIVLGYRSTYDSIIHTSLHNRLYYYYCYYYYYSHYYYYYYFRVFQASEEW